MSAQEIGILILVGLILVAVFGDLARLLFGRRESEMRHRKWMRDHSKRKGADRIPPQDSGVGNAFRANVFRDEWRARLGSHRGSAIYRGDEFIPQRKH